MKNYGLIGTLLVLSGLLTACVETYEPDSKTWRGEEMYRVWLENFTEYNTCYLSTLFWVDNMLQLTPEQRDSLIEEDYGKNDLWEAYPDGTCLVAWGKLLGADYGDYTRDSRMLVKTDGKRLNTVGAQWEVVLNIPLDYVYSPAEKIKPMPDASPQTLQEIGFYAYPEFLPFTITCIGKKKWQLQDTEGTEKSDSFSVNYTMEQTQIGSNPELFMSDHVVLNGQGRLLAKKGVGLDYTLEDYNLEWNARGVGGSVTLTAIELATAQEVSAHIDCFVGGYDVTYRGITTHHSY